MRRRAVALPGTHILPLTPTWGVASAEGWFDSFLSAASVLDLLQNLDQPVDGVVMAGFGEHGREGARELLDVPVVDITEAAALYALVLGRRFAVVTTLARAAGQIEDSLRTAGLLDRCAGVFATGLGVLDLELDPATTEQAFVDASRQAMAAGAEVICLGCAGDDGTGHPHDRTARHPRGGRRQLRGRPRRVTGPPPPHHQQERNVRGSAAQTPHAAVGGTGGPTHPRLSTCPNIRSRISPETLSVRAGRSRPAGRRRQ